MATGVPNEAGGVPVLIGGGYLQGWYGAYCKPSLHLLAGQLR